MTLLHASKAVRCVIAISAVVAALVFGAALAEAGSYTVNSCLVNSRRGIDGWQSGVNGAWSYITNDCHGANQYMMGVASDAPNAHAQWQFNAPAGTYISAFSIHRAAILGVNRDFGTPLYVLETFPNNSYRNEVRGNIWESTMIHWGWESASGIREQKVQILAGCGGGLTCLGNPSANFYMNMSYITLGDDTAPQVVGLNGNLANQDVLKGTEHLSASTSDSGGGVYQYQILIDDQVVQATTIDTDGGRCVKDGVGNFDFAKPCPSGPALEADFDTTVVDDGEHNLKLRVTDAAGNTTTTLNRKVTVANELPSAPEGLQAQLTASGKLDVDWKNPQTTLPIAKAHYKYCEKPLSGRGSYECSLVLRKQSGLNIQKFTDDQPEDKPVLKVWLEDSTGNSSESKAAYAEIKPPPVVDDPQNPGGGNNDRDDREVGSEPGGNKDQDGGHVLDRGQLNGDSSLVTKQGVQLFVVAKSCMTQAKKVKRGKGKKSSKKLRQRRKLVAKCSRSERALRTNYGRQSSVVVKLANANGEGVPNARIDFVYRNKTVMKESGSLGKTTTNQDGYAELRLPRKTPSRQLTAEWREYVNDHQPAATRSVDLNVISSISVRARRTGRLAMQYKGKVKSQPYPYGSLVKVFVRAKGTRSWVQQAEGKVRKNGVWKAKYIAKRGHFPKGNYEYKAKIFINKHAPVWPFERGESKIKPLKLH